MITFYLQKEVAKKQIDFAHLAVMNRNLFNGVFFDKLPKRLTLKVSLMINEFERFYPENDIAEQAQAFVNKLETVTCKQGVSALLEMQDRLVGTSGENSEKLFMAVEVS